MDFIEQVGRLDGKVIIVTGGNSGIGYEAVKFYTKYGAHVIMASRSIERGMEAKERIYQELKNECKITDENAESRNLLDEVEEAGSDSFGFVDVMKLDLASLESIKEFANEVNTTFERLDILLNNAGVMMTPYALTEDGFEMQFGVNYLGHFALTGRLLDLLKVTPGARVVNISSNAHKSGNISFKNLMFEDGLGYTSFGAYSRSKLANLLFTYELQRRINQTVYDIRVLAAHPGGANTRLNRHIEDNFIVKNFKGIFLKLVQSAYDGALPGLRASLDPKAYGGEYYGPSGPMEMAGKPVRVESNALSHNSIVAKRLFKESEKLTKVKFDLS